MAKGAVYVIFDGDEDKWAYGYLKGWNANPNMEFELKDAHDLDSMTGRAQEEAYVKANLRKRMEKSVAVLVLVGEKTKNLYKYVRWELELALELELPVIVANLNGKRARDTERCPAILRDACAVHVAFKAAIIEHALGKFVAEFRSFPAEKKKGGARHYNDTVYAALGIKD